MSLYQAPPESIAVDGTEYPIETDFRAWVNFQGILLGRGTDAEKAEKITDFMDRLGLLQNKASLDAMIRFYAGASAENATGGANDKQAFDFEKDSEYIFSAFLDSYGIDLSTARLHWWRFKALFKSLPQDCQLCKIMHYRTVELHKVPKDQRPFYREMKKRYALGDTDHGYRTKEEVIAYYKQRRAEVQAQMSALRSSKRPSADRS